MVTAYPLTSGSGSHPTLRFPYIIAFSHVCLIRLALCSRLNTWWQRGMFQGCWPGAGLLCEHPSTLHVPVSGFQRAHVQEEFSCENLGAGQNTLPRSEANSCRLRTRLLWQAFVPQVSFRTAPQTQYLVFGPCFYLYPGPNLSSKAA